MTTLVMNKTSNLGKIISRGLVAFANGVWNFFESVGRARAATEFARMGRHDLARNIMLGDKDV